MYKKVCCTCKVAFLLIRPIVVFHHPSCLRRLALHSFILQVVWANHKYYRELRFQPWLKIYIILKELHGLYASAIEKKRVSHSYRACVRPRVFILLLFAWMHLTTRKSELYFPFLTLRTCYSSCVVFEQSRKKTPSIRQSCQNKLLKHFVSIQITVTSTHVEGFDPVSCGLLFWKEIEKKFLYHPSFRRFSRKPFLVKIVSFESL